MKARLNRRCRLICLGLFGIIAGCSCSSSIDENQKRTRLEMRMSLDDVVEAADNMDLALDAAAAEPGDPSPKSLLQCRHDLLFQAIRHAGRIAALLPRQEAIAMLTTVERLHPLTILALAKAQDVEGAKAELRNLRNRAVNTRPQLGD